MCFDFTLMLKQDQILKKIPIQKEKKLCQGTLIQNIGSFFVQGAYH